MTLSEMKSKINFLMKGDVSTTSYTPNDWLLLLNDAINIITTDTIPESLIADDVDEFGEYTISEDQILKLTYYGVPIRKSLLPSADEDSIDLDEELCTSIPHKIASQIAKDPLVITRNGDTYLDIIDAYNWKFYTKHSMEVL